jgi:Bacterial tandem repeat domain 1
MKLALRIRTASSLLTVLALPACGNAGDAQRAQPAGTAKQADGTSGPTAAIDWAMMEDQFDPTSMFIHPVPTTNALLDTGWNVTLDGCASTPTPGIFDPVEDYTWDVALPSGPLHVDSATACAQLVQFPAQGVYSVTLTVTTLYGRTASTSRYISVRDILVVSIGDSVASGEGNPDSLPSETAAESGSPPPLIWSDRRCHRSGWSGAARAAGYLENVNRHYGVTFLSVACSGATVQQGLVGPYAGEENPTDLPDLPSQLQQVAQLLCPNPGGCTRDQLRNIDVLLMQVGANDIGFANIVQTCANPLTTCSSDGGFTSSVANSIAALPAQYSLLDQELNTTLKYSSAYIGEYFDPTHDQTGAICSDIYLEGAASDHYAILDYTPIADGDINYSESSWAYNDVILPLNNAVQTAASTYGWNYVGGIASAFGTHGYCIPGVLNERWIRHYSESKFDQGNVDGTMHPNINGQSQYASAIYAAAQPVTAFPHVTAVWRPAAVPQTRQFDLTDDQIETANGQMAEQGQAMKVLAPYVMNHDQLRYDAAWEPSPQPQLHMFEVTIDNLVDTYDQLWDDGWRLVILNSVVLPDDDVRYNAVWEPSTASEIQVYGWTYDDYRNEYDQLWDQGWRLKILNAFVLSGDQVRYNAVWEPSTSNEIQVYGWAYGDYRNYYDQIWSQGWRLKSLDTFVLSGDQVRYNAVWEPTGVGETQAYEYANEDFRTTDDALQQQGWSLGILTSSVTH